VNTLCAFAHELQVTALRNQAAGRGLPSLLRWSTPPLEIENDRTAAGRRIVYNKIARNRSDSAMTDPMKAQSATHRTAEPLPRSQVPSNLSQKIKRTVEPFTQLAATGPRWQDSKVIAAKTFWAAPTSANLFRTSSIRSPPRRVPHPVSHVRLRQVAIDWNSGRRLLRWT